MVYAYFNKYFFGIPLNYVTQTCYNVTKTRKIIRFSGGLCNLEEITSTYWNLGMLDRGYRELNPLNCGFEACTPFHTGFGLRDYYMIHYIESGCGTLYSEKGEYKISRGEAFIVKPHENARYIADGNDPWTYVWIGFNGELSKKLDSLPSPVIEISGTGFTMIRAIKERSNTREEMAASALFMIYADIMSGRSSRPHYVRRTADTINSLYMTDITVGGLAEGLGLDRHYLTRIFKENLGCSIQEYLITVRMEQAKKLLIQNYPVNLTAELVGYQDCFNFSKMFKKKFGISPRKFAQEAKTN